MKYSSTSPNRSHRQTHRNSPRRTTTPIWQGFHIWQDFSVLRRNFSTLWPLTFIFFTSQRIRSRNRRNIGTYFNLYSRICCFLLRLLKGLNGIRCEPLWRTRLSRSSIKAKPSVRAISILEKSQSKPHKSTNPYRVRSFNLQSWPSGSSTTNPSPSQSETRS